MTAKIQMKALEVKWTKVVNFWNWVVNHELNAVPVFQRLNRRMFIQIDDSVKITPIIDFNCCESLKELIFHQSIHSHEKIKKSIQTK
jgi:hypothetical protein